MIIVMNQPTKPPQDKSNISSNPIAYLLLKGYAIISEYMTDEHVINKPTATNESTTIDNYNLETASALLSHSKPLDTTISITNSEITISKLNETIVDDKLNETITDINVESNSANNHEILKELIQEFATENNPKTENNGNTKDIIANTVDTSELDAKILELIQDEMKIEDYSQNIETTKIPFIDDFKPEKTSSSTQPTEQVLPTFAEEYIINKIPYAIAQDTQQSKNIITTFKSKTKVTPLADKKKPSVEFDLELDSKFLAGGVNATLDSHNLKDTKIIERFRLGSKDYNLSAKLDVNKKNLEVALTLFKELSIKVTGITNELDMDKMNLVAKSDPIEITFTKKDKIKKVKVNISKIIELLSSNDVCDTSTSPKFIKFSISFEYNKQISLELQITSAITITINFEFANFSKLTNNMRTNLITNLKDLFVSIFQDIKAFELALEGEVLKDKFEVSKAQKQEYQTLRF